MLPAGAACWGYRLWDEPNAEMFDQLAQRVEALRTVRTGRLGYINLFPNYASSKQLGVDSYDEYVKRFVETVDVDVLSMDHYPLFKPNADGRDRYCRNLETMRKYSLEKNIPRNNPDQCDYSRRGRSSARLPRRDLHAW